jgi:hypothetical protein
MARERMPRILLLIDTSKIGVWGIEETKGTYTE